MLSESLTISSIVMARKIQYTQKTQLLLHGDKLNPDCAVVSYCDLKILAATLVSRLCSSTYLLICLRHKIAPTARFAMVFCASLWILLHNLGLKVGHLSDELVGRYLIRSFDVWKQAILTLQQPQIVLFALHRGMNKRDQICSGCKYRQFQYSPPGARRPRAASG